MKALIEFILIYLLSTFTILVIGLIPIKIFGLLAGGIGYIIFLIIVFAVILYVSTKRLYL